jgi:hypothetical protein
MHNVFQIINIFLSRAHVNSSECFRGRGSYKTIDCCGLPVAKVIKHKVFKLKCRDVVEPISSSYLRPGSKYWSQGGDYWQW